jgi:hypothetical protein
MTVILFRRVFFYIIAVVYFGEAALALWAPQSAAELVGYQFLRVDGFSEFRAVYVGMWSVLGFWSVIAARRAHQPLPGDVVASVIFGESVARMLSLVLDGVPGSITYLHIAMELAPLAILLLRPPTPSGTTPSRLAAARS